MFAEYWYMMPEICFSESFFENILNSEKILIFNQYEYDNSPNSEYHLPIFNPLYNVNDSSIIPPHIINSQNVTKLLNITRDKKATCKDSILRLECEMFERLLVESSDTNNILVLLNHDY